jgi:predicted nucleic-acid-binding Zn-ribbon protein
MNMEKLECPKCSGEMIEGFVVDESVGTYRVSKWQEGKPKERWLSGAKVDTMNLIKVRTYRCAGCGYLESYAKEGA